MTGTAPEQSYELLELIGEGAMGQVYLARHKGLGRLEALKILAADLAAEEEFVVRLRREGRATTLLTHPNIVSVYGFGRLADGRYYLAMEYLRGETLEALIDREGSLALGLGMRLLYQLASAMAHAHEQEVVHRDIKPANLMVIDQHTSAPYLKVLDFGLAKIVHKGYAESMAVSQTGNFYGTPGYMAPERVRGVSADPRIDIYSFGCVAYTVLTGQAPFVGRAIDVLHAHQNLEPKPPSTHRSLPARLDAIVMRCLEKDPERRFTSGHELCAALHHVEGFSAERARRRSLSPMIENTDPMSSAAKVVAMASTIRPAATTHRTAMDIGETLAFGHAQDFGPQHAEDGYHQALFALAEELHRKGCRDKRLIICLAKLTRTRGMLRAYDERLSEFLVAREKLDADFRRRESELRFALGEFNFDRGIEGESQAESEVNDIMEELMRSEHLHRRAVQDILDVEIAQVAARHNVFETQRSDFGTLLQIVDTFLDEIVPDASLATRIEEFHDAKASWESAIRHRQH